MPREKGKEGINTSVTTSTFIQPSEFEVCSEELSHALGEKIKASVIKSEQADKPEEDIFSEMQRALLKESSPISPAFVRGLKRHPSDYIIYETESVESTGKGLKGKFQGILRRRRESKKQQEQTNGTNRRKKSFLRRRKKHNPPSVNKQDEQTSKFVSSESRFCVTPLETRIKSLREQRERHNKVAIVAGPLGYFIAYYEDLLRNFSNASESERLSMLEKPYSTILYIDEKGFKLTNEVVSPLFLDERLSEKQKARLAKKQPTEKVMKPEEDTEETIQTRQSSASKYGTHYVVYVSGETEQEGGCYLKRLPEGPATEFTIKVLEEAITKRTSKINIKIIIAQTGEKIVVVSASDEVPGVNFEHWLSENETADINIDNFSLRFLLDLLTIPRDNKADNNILQGTTLYSIDAGEGLGAPILKNHDRKGKTTGPTHFMSLKSVIFCMDKLMNQPVSLEVKDFILSQTPEQIVIMVLKKLLQQDKVYEPIIKLLGETQLKDFIPLKVHPGTFPKLANKIRTLKRIFSEQSNAKITHQQVLEILMPVVAEYYKHMRHKHENAFETIQAIYSYKAGNIEEVLDAGESIDESLWEKLEKYNLTRREEHKSCTQTVKKACCEFFREIDFGDKTPQQQNELLTDIISSFTFIPELTLKDCEVIDDRALGRLVSSLKKLKSFTLKGENRVTVSGLISAFDRRRECKIILHDIEKFTASELTRLAKFFGEQLTIAIDGEEYPVKNKSARLLRVALMKRDNSLIKFALKWGFPLYQDRFNIREEKRENPLHIVAKQKDRHKLFELLLKLGAPLYDSDGQGLSVFDWVVDEENNQEITKRDRQFMVAALLRHGAYLRRPFLLHRDDDKEARAKKVIDYGVLAHEQDYQDEALRQGLIKFMLDMKKFDKKVFSIFFMSGDEALRKESSVDLSGNYRFEETFIEALEYIKHVNLVGCRGITKKHLEGLSAARVKNIDLSLLQIVEAGLIDFKSELPENIFPLKVGNLTINLTKIMLTGREIDEMALTNLCRILTSKGVAESLTHFELSGANLEKASALLELGKLIRSLSHIKNIHTLILDNNRLYNNHIGDLARGSGLRNLSYISLQNNKISGKEPKVEDDFVALATFIKKCDHLKKVRLGGNPLGDKGCQMIIEALKNNKSELELIALTTVNAGLNGIKALVECVRAKPTLVQCHFRDNGKEVGNELASKLAKTEQALKIAIQRNIDAKRKPFFREMDRILPDPLSPRSKDKEVEGRGRERQRRQTEPAHFFVASSSGSSSGSSSESSDEEGAAPSVWKRARQTSSQRNRRSITGPPKFTLTSRKGPGIFKSTHKQHAQAKRPSISKPLIRSSNKPG